jgi:hypothetical protein
MAVSINSTALIFSDGTYQNTAVTQRFLADSNTACTAGVSIISIPGDGVAYQTNTIYLQTQKSGNGTTLEEIRFKTDGTKMYILDSSPDQVLQFNLSTAWQIDTATQVYTSGIADFTGSSLGAMTNSYGMDFSSDGSKLFLTNQAGSSSKIVQYAVSSAWEVNTATVSMTSNLVIGVTPGETNPTSLKFKSDGTKMYVLGLTLDKVHEYDLSSAWTLSTATLVGNVSVSNTSPNALEFNNTGSKMYIGDYTSDIIYEYNLSTPWQVNTATLVANISISTSAGRTAGLGNVSGIAYSSNGHKMYLSDINDSRIQQFTLENTPSLRSIAVSGDLTISGNSTHITIG